MVGDTGGDLLAKLQRYAGREFVFTSPDPIGAAPIRQYALAVGDTNPLYRDPDFARAHGLRDVMAPPTLIPDSWAYFDGDMDERSCASFRACAPATSTSSSSPRTPTT